MSSQVSLKVEDGVRRRGPSRTVLEGLYFLLLVLKMEEGGEKNSSWKG